MQEKLIRVSGIQYQTEVGNLIAFLTKLDNDKPFVTFTAEPDNPVDPNAVAVRCRGIRCGYVQKKDRHRDIVLAALQLSHDDLLMGHVVRCEINDQGCFYVKVQIDDDVSRTYKPNLWADWNPDVPAMSWTEHERKVCDALLVLARADTLDDEAAEAYGQIIVEHGRHALWLEAQQRLEEIQTRYQHVNTLQPILSQLEHLQKGMCSQHREEERRNEWLPACLKSEQARQVIDQWHCQTQISKHAPDRQLLHNQLNYLNEQLSLLPGFNYSAMMGDAAVLVRAHYQNVPAAKWQLLLSVLILRRYIKELLSQEQVLSPADAACLDEELFHFIHPELGELEGWAIHQQINRLVKSHGMKEICDYLVTLKEDKKILLPQSVKTAHEELIRMGMPDSDGRTYKTFEKYYRR